MSSIRKPKAEPPAAVAVAPAPPPPRAARRRHAAPPPDWPPRVELLSDILDAAPARVAYIDRDFRYRYVNREFCDFAQKTPEQILGLTTRELVGPKVKRQLDPFARAALAGRTIVREGWVDYRLNGRKYINWVFAPKRALDGRVEGFVVFMRDQTDHKTREEELSHRGAQLEAILDCVADGVNMVDAEGRLVLCNQGFLDMYGFPPELGRPGTHVSDFVRHRLMRGGHYPREDRSRPIEELVAERVRQVLSTGDEIQEEVGPEGRTFAVRRRRLKDGTIVSAYHDITALREAERARRAQRDAVRRAEQLGTAVSVLASVAHEINNPLAVVAAQATLLAEEAEGTPLAERAERVRLAAQRCGRIVTELLASARRGTREREEVDLARVVEGALDLSGYELGAAGIRLEVKLPRRMPHLMGNANQLTHLVANLVSNAQQALRDRPPPRRLTISAARRRGAVELRVADNGPGIPEALRERIFEPFFTTKPVGIGTGVGLSLCRAVAEAHGGRIHAEETPGGGASFVLCLPLAREG